MATQISKNSWLVFAELLDCEGTVFWDTPDFPEIIPQDKDIFVEVDSRYVNRIDLLAFDYYKDANLWWVIALANGLDLIPTDIRLGVKLRIPNKKYIDSLISKGSK